MAVPSVGSRLVENLSGSWDPIWICRVQGSCGDEGIVGVGGEGAQRSIASLGVHPLPILTSIKRTGVC